MAGAAGAWGRLALLAVCCVAVRAPATPAHRLTRRSPASPPWQLPAQGPGTRARPRAAVGAALLYSCTLAAVLAVSGALLFNRSVQANAAAAFSPEALVALLGERVGRAVALLMRLAALAVALASLPQLMAPFRRDDERDRGREAGGRSCLEGRQGLPVACWCSPRAT